jgi:hypothetical protein
VVAADELLPFLSEAIGETIESNRDMNLIAHAGYDESYVGNKAYNGAVPVTARYGDYDLLLAIALGATGTPALQTDLYLNTYTLNDDMDNSFTMAFDKQVSIWEYAGCKINSLTIRGTAGMPVEFEFDIVCKALDVSSGTNTSGTMNSAVFLAAPVIMTEDLTLWIGDNADALDSGDEIEVTSFELVINNTLRTDLYTNQATISEPIRNGRRVIDLTLGLGTYESNTYKTWYQNNTDVQARLKFTHPDAALTDDYDLMIKMGKLRVSAYDPAIGGEEAITPEINFFALRAAEDSKSWASMTEELEISVINSLSADPLA